VGLFLFGFGVLGTFLALLYFSARVAAGSRGHAWRQAATTVGLTDIVSMRFLGVEKGLTGLLAASSDDDDEVRLRAAMALGDLGREVLLQVASSSEVTDDRAARALTALGEHLAGARAIGILRDALAAGRAATARAAVDALGRLGGRDVVEPLSAVLLAEDDELARSAAAALGSSGKPTAEPALIAALDRAAPRTWIAVAEALGEVGTAAAVEPLRELGDRHLLGLSFQRASRQAIAEIQARLGVSPGQLALAEGESGRLALTETGLEGRVSVPVEGESSSHVEGDAADETQWPTDKTKKQQAVVEGDAEMPAGVEPPRRRGRES
jgi:HEAT repeat protein